MYISKKTFLLLYTICVFLATFKASSQEDPLPNVTPPSPMAYEIARYGDLESNLYTGTTNVTIPLYVINFEGWQLPLSLSYTTGGIRASQEASEVGLGWALNSTAVITRSVKGINDFHEGLYGTGYVYDPNDRITYLNNREDLSCNELVNIMQVGLRKQSYDTQPDEFNYNFFGFSGAFTLSKKSTADDPVQTLKRSKDGVKIVFEEADKTFTITTPTGFKGYFTIKERTTNFGGSHDNVDDTNHSTYGGNLFDGLTYQYKGRLRVVTGWYLERIVSPNGKEIRFEYNIGPNENSAYVSITRPAITKHPSAGKEGIPLGTVSFSRLIQEHVYQTKIEIPQELSITFGREDRHDLEANFIANTNQTGLIFPNSEKKPQRYTGMQIQGLHSDSTLDRQISFGQSYFNGQYLNLPEGASYHSESYQKLRSRLDYVNVGNQTYSLFYHDNSSGMPNKSTLATDYLGFYNEVGNSVQYSTFLGGYGFDMDISISLDMVEEFLANRYYFQYANRKPSLNATLLGTLKKITYPTGGHTLFEYELNRFYSPGKPEASDTDPTKIVMATDHNGTAGNVTLGGLRIKAIENKDADNTLLSKKTYQYLTFGTTKSSGKLISPFIYAFDRENFLEIQESPCEHNVPTTGPRYVFYDQSSIPQHFTAQGKRIGYSYVEETFEHPFRKFTNTYEFINQAAQFSENGTIHSVSLNQDAGLNGKLLTKKAKNEYSTTVKEENFTIDQTFPSTVKGLQYQQHNYYAFYSLLNYELPQTNGTILNHTTKESFTNGILENASGFAYDAFNQKKEITTTGSDGSPYRTIIKRVSDYPNPCDSDTTSTACTLYLQLLQENRIGVVLEKIVYKDDKVIAATGYRYGQENKLLVLKEVFEYDRSLGAYNPSANGFDFNGSYRSIVTLDQYDINGRLLQKTTQGQLVESYLWGYDGTLPIVVAQNITHNNLLSAYEASGRNIVSLQDHALTANALITAYEHNPKVGVAKITEPSGVATQYEYDNYERLQLMKDADNNNLTEYQYRYDPRASSKSLSVNLSKLTFGVLNAGTQRTAYLQFENTGMEHLSFNLQHFSGASSFSSPRIRQQITLAPGETLDFPIVFTAPVAEQEYEGTATFGYGDKTITVSLEGTSGVETRLLRVDKTCYQATAGFQSISITLFNDGNNPLQIQSASVDDSCWNVSDVSTLSIPAQGSQTIAVQSQCSMGNWDGTATVSILTDGTGTITSAVITISNNSCD